MFCSCFLVFLLNLHFFQFTSFLLCVCIINSYDFIEYAEVVGTALGYPTIGGGSECEDTIREGVNQLMLLVNSTTPMGSNPSIPAILKPCSTMDNDLDVSTYQVCHHACVWY